MLSFLFLHENICCGYSLEVPQQGASNEYPQHIFLWRNKKDIMWIPPFICSYVSLLLYTVCRLLTFHYALEPLTRQFIIKQPWENSADISLMMFFLLSPENRILHFMQSVRNFQILFSRRNKKNISNCPLLKYLLSRLMLKVDPKSVVSKQKCIDYIEKWP